MKKIERWGDRYRERSNMTVREIEGVSERGRGKRERKEERERQRERKKKRE